MTNPTALQSIEASAAKPPRLHYLDWLRVIATLGVFLFHVSNVFNTTDFEIQNAEGSEGIVIAQSFFFPWGMPLFFLVAGAGAWFALRRRSGMQFTRERTLRILVPFLTGTLVLGPIQLYLSWRHRVETGVIDWTFQEFVGERLWRIGPKLFGAIGYHMWFLGFLFAFALLALPLFVWLKGEKGRAFIASLVRFCELRGAILLFAIPIIVVRVVLHHFFPVQQDWADFLTFGTFYILGYVVYADEGFARVIRRDWPIILVASLAAMAGGMVIGLSLESFDIEAPPLTLWENLLWGLIAACGWCWSLLMLYIGMRFLNQDSRALRYGQATILPFFVVHQAVILAIAYFVVQWQASILFKFSFLLVSSFAVTIGLVELVIKRVRLLQMLFGMKA